MIKIINGTYGMREGFKVTPVKKGDAPISLDPAEEKRLVSIGVAEYVAENNEPDGSKNETPTDPPASEQEGDEVKDFKKMKLDELKEYAVSLGIEVPKSARSKKAVIALIEAAGNADGESGADDENTADDNSTADDNENEAPTFSAQMPT